MRAPDFDGRSDFLADAIPFARRWALAAVCVAGLGLRVYLAGKAFHSADLDAYRETFALQAAGRAVYEGTDRYNYPPFWMWLLGCLGRFAEVSGMAFETAVRAFLVAVDAAVAAGLFLLARRVRVVSSWAAAALYLGNPVAIWVSAVQAQFDGLVVLFLIVALITDADADAGADTEARRDAGPRWVSMLALGISMGFKQITLLHPILWVRGRRRWLALVPYLVVLAAFVPYARQARAIFAHVVFYRSVPRSYGLSELVQLDARWALPVSILALGATCWAAWRLAGRNRPRASLFLFLVLLVLSPGLGSQYLLWPLALGALFGGSGLVLTSVSGLLWTLGTSRFIPVVGISQFGGQLLWLCLVLWLFQEMRALGLIAFSPSPGGKGTG